jgi:hypothetical protein
MTTLTKPVRRVATTTIREQGKNRNIVVVLRAPGLIGLRAAGCRREYQLPLDAVYAMAVKAHVASEKREKRKARVTQ